MFDLFINTAKFITSEDARKSASTLIDMVRRSPEWQKDICTLVAHINRVYVEQAILLSDLTTSKMEKMNFASEGITAFKVIFLELIRNAFEHGCKSDKDVVKITIEITSTFVGLRVVNPKGSKFNLKAAIETNESLLAKNLSILRGRGLILVKQLADSLKMVEDGRGIKAVVYSERVSFRSEVFDGLVIITLNSGLFNPALSERLSKEVSRFPQLDIIINLSKFNDISTEAQSEIVKLSVIKIKTDEDLHRKIVTLLDVDAPEIMLPRQILVFSWREALTKLGKMNLLGTLPLPYKDPEHPPMFRVIDETTAFCAIHGPFDPSLGKCPYPHSDDDYQTD
jgi:anti-sigma regulatory factor (Ser/Thr protein kinase)